MEEKIFAFIKAQAEAEEKGEHEFVCPLCGGSAHFGRDKQCKHLHTGCDDCGIMIME